jgi:peptide/nickel transport system substrate-binding protein
MNVRLYLSLAMLALGAGLLTAGLAGPGALGSSGRVRDGGTLRISYLGASFDGVDPALSYSSEGWALLDATCARLMTYPDARPPRGFQLVPEVARAYPRSSRDGKTYTFTLRNGFRFSNGAPVRASAFAQAFERLRDLRDQSAGAQYVADVSSVTARGNRLVVRLTKPAPDFAARMTMPFFCAVLPRLPADPEGVTALTAAGPYYVASYLRGRRVVLKRNRYYSGRRPHHVDGFVVDLQAGSPPEVLDRIERSQADWGLAPPPFYFDSARALRRKYGVNRARFFVKPGLLLRAFALNTARPLFRNNVRLRRAVNFAVDRRAIVRVSGSDIAARPTDQHLPPGLPGFRDARIYPNRPDVDQARRLARGHTRSGKAVLYTIDDPVAVPFAQILQRNLKKIGLAVEIRPISGQAYLGRLLTPGEPFDIAFYAWASDYIDPYQYVNQLLDGRFAGTSNVARFNSARFNRLMRLAARRKGRARYQAYGKLDIELARAAAPMIPIAIENQPTLVSKRVDPRCVVLRPTLDLTAVCLKR